MDAQKMQRCHEYVEALEEEQKKIQVFQRELPLCLELVTQAIEACRKELSSTSTTSEQCSEQTTSVSGGPVLEEFIPTKKTEENGEHESPTPPEENVKRSDWLRSVQLWNPSPDTNTNTNEVSNPERVVGKKAKVVEVKPNNSNCGGFQPFQREKKRVFSESNDPQPAAVKAVDSAPAVKAVASAPAPATTTSSTTETCGVVGKGGEEHIHQQQSQTQSQTRRKQRRCWSPELHRRFLHALQQLGGSHVATPKQIRDHMKVDGLTNDEVKSHLQKYRLHTRRPAASMTPQGNGNSQQPQFVVVGGIWVPSPPQDVPPPSDLANNGGGIYAPVTLRPPTSPQSPKRSVERSSGQCNSQAASSSTNTATSSPVS
ncbi:myb-like transcription factor family protein [Raphanus sativus]|uniref:Transcription factor HHO2 n=1 Tax=Raphanus sativus TaxID=3726 RepID=A0A9W3CKY0_RAPSA|nr:transcription factor HHO2 [Raphanus sativus]KAJ4909734.1 myb-like transcription factor family protein [Raphanus sativus]